MSPNSPEQNDDGARRPGLDAEAYARAYDALAEAIDRAGPAGERELLARLCLLLMDRVGDAAAVESSIAAAERAAPAATVRPGDT